MSGQCALVESTVQVSPSVDTVWDRIWRYQPSDARDDAMLQREEASPRWQLVVDRLERAFGSINGLQTIELGSGRGDLSILLARRGAQVTLLDRSERALEEASKRFARLGLPARFEQADLLTRSDSREGRFDVSLSIGVIEHFAGAQFSKFKQELAEVAVETLGPIGAEMQRLSADPGHVDGVLRDGAARARALAEPVLEQTRELVGLLAP